MVADGGAAEWLPGAIGAAGGHEEWELAGAAAAAGPRGVRTVRRRPVLLVPGWSDGARRLGRLRLALTSRGWPPWWVSAVDFADRYGSNRVHALEIAAAAEALLRETGAAELDVVAHSMGGLAARLAATDGGLARRVRRLVLLGTPHRGTWAAWLAWGAGGREMRPGSDLLSELAVYEREAHAAELVCIRAAYDLRVFPASSARLAQARDAGAVGCTHAGMLRSARVADAVTSALLRR